MSVQPQKGPAQRGLPLLLSRLSSLILSIVLSFAIWVYVNNLENPLIVQEFPQRIPLVIRGLDADLQPLQDLSNESVTVRARAPQNAWSELAVNDFVAYIDLTDQSEGVYTADVQVDVSDPQVQIIEVSNASLRVQLDRTASKEIPVNVDLLEAVAYGYDPKPAIVDPMTVTVSGPATQVDLVVAAMAHIKLSSARSQVEQQQALEAVNRQNKVVTGVRIEPAEANVVVPVEPWPGRKTVAVRLNLVGEPASGYRLSTVDIQPATVVLQGDPEFVNAVPGFIETQILGLTEATGEINQSIGLIVPEGITVLDGNSVQVRVAIAALEDSQTIKLQPLVQNLGVGLQALVALETVDVIVSGPVPQLGSIKEDDIVVTLDLTGLLSGTHTVIPKVALPGGLTEEAVLPSALEVVISETVVATGTIPPGESK